MFSFKKDKGNHYIYLEPAENDLAKWELIDQDELDYRVSENKLSEGARLFRVSEEIGIRFEKITYLE